jgi:hypothetical protein
MSASPPPMKNSHTPGPWFATALGTSVAHRGALDVLTHVATCALIQNSGSPTPNKTAQANARLIAAAPRMLALLERLEDSPLEFDAYDGTLAGEINATIRAAKGGA